MSKYRYNLQVGLLLIFPEQVACLGCPPEIYCTRRTLRPLAEVAAGNAIRVAVELPPKGSSPSPTSPGPPMRPYGHTSAGHMGKCSFACFSILVLQQIQHMMEDALTCSPSLTASSM